MVESHHHHRKRKLLLNKVPGLVVSLLSTNPDPERTGPRFVLQEADGTFRKHVFREQDPRLQCPHNNRAANTNIYHIVSWDHLPPVSCRNSWPTLHLSNAQSLPPMHPFHLEGKIGYSECRRHKPNLECSRLERWLSRACLMGNRWLLQYWN